MGMTRKKVTAKRKRGRSRKGKRHKLIITLGPDGARPRRPAEVDWSVDRPFTLRNLLAHRDCAQWVLQPGWTIHIHDGGESAKQDEED